MLRYRSRRPIELPPSYQKIKLGYIGVKYGGYIGILENKMETTIYGQMDIFSKDSSFDIGLYDFCGCLRVWAHTPLNKQYETPHRPLAKGR